MKNHVKSYYAIQNIPTIQFSYKFFTTINKSKASQYPYKTSDNNFSPLVYPRVQRRDCLPRTSVAFPKTHKSGGSTLQNILLRFGAERTELLFAFPDHGGDTVLKKLFPKREILYLF